jgi:hypothetical protein
LTPPQNDATDLFNFMLLKELNVNNY